MERSGKVDRYIAVLVLGVIKSRDQFIEYGVTCTLHLGRLVNDDEDGVCLLLKRLLKDEQMLIGVAVCTGCIKECKVDILAKRNRELYIDDTVDKRCAVLLLNIWYII